MNPFNFLRNLLPSMAAPAPPREFSRRLNPRYLNKPATGVLDADYIHSVVTQGKEGQMTPLLSLYRDIESADDVIAGAMATRRLAVLSELPSVQPCRKGVLADQRAADKFAACMDNSPTFLDGCKHWLSSAVWPVAVNEIRWIPGALDFATFELRQVPLEQLDYGSGDLRIARVDSAGAPLTESIYPDPARLIVHRGHLMTHPDTWGGPFRALLFWHLFGACDRDWWARFLERFGAPFLVGKYDPDDEESRANLETAFSEAARTFGIVATSDTTIELHEARSSVGADAFAKFLDIATSAKTRLILGQTLSSKADATGMGSGTASLQGDVRTEYKQWDRLCLAATVRRGIIEPFMRHNRLAGEPPKLCYPGDPGDLSKLGGFLQASAGSGLELDDAGLEALNAQTGLSLRRSSAPPPPPQLQADAALVAQIIAAASIPNLGGSFAGLSRALRRDYAAIASAVRTGDPSQVAAALHPPAAAASALASTAFRAAVFAS